jgi:spermidine synthase
MDLFYEDEQFKIEILLGDARESIPKIKEKIDIVYQDAFSPAHNPLLWTREYFKDIRAICREDALLTTYSTAAAIRLGLYENDFLIFVHRAEMMRYSTIASLNMLENLEYIDMELKKERNPTARSMKDAEYQ